MLQEPTAPSEALPPVHSPTRPQARASFSASAFREVSLRTNFASCKSLLLTQRQHFLRLRLRWGLFIEQVGNIGPTAHVQALGNPLQTHGRFRTNVARQHGLRPVAFAARPQRVLIPARPSPAAPFLPSLGTTASTPWKLQ